MRNFNSAARRLVKCAPILLVIWIIACGDTIHSGMKLALQQQETKCNTNESEKKLFDAIARGDLKGVESLLADGVSPYARIEISDDGEESCSSAPMQALRQGQTEIVKLLLKAFDRGSWNDRHYYSRFHCEEWIIRDLVAPGKGVNTPDDNGQTPLSSAASCGSVALTRLLIENGADVNLRNRFHNKDGYTPLMAAADSVSVGDNHNVNRAKIVSVLIRAGADMNATDNEGNTALILVAGKATYFNGTNPVINELLSSGAEVNSDNNDGDTALIKAVKKLNDGYGNKYASAFDQDTKGVIETINILAPAGAHINAENRSGETALKILAARSGTGDTEILKALLAHNVDINKIGSTREPALILAIRRAAGHSNSDLVRALIKAGVDVNASDYAGTPALTVAVRDSGNAEVARLLLGAGARVNSKDQNGDTALIAAVREYLPTGNLAVKKALRRNPEVIRALLVAGADTSVKDERGYTAVDLAKQANNKDIIQLLSVSNTIRK